MIYKTYGEKLKDPRWQKKRLEVLQRDEWTCQRCFSKEKTLHVHHLLYGPCEPWEMSDFYLVTLCDLCHEEIELEKARIERTTQNIIRPVPETFGCLACGYNGFQFISVGFRPPYVVIGNCVTCGMLYKLSRDNTEFEPL